MCYMFKYNVFGRNANRNNPDFGDYNTLSVYLSLRWDNQHANADVELSVHSFNELFAVVMCQVKLVLLLPHILSVRPYCQTQVCA